MGEYGLKIKNIKAATLFGYNQGVRDRYDYTEAVFNNSLFSDYILNHGMKAYKDTSTRDIICLDFDFGTRSYKDEIDHISQLKLDGALKNELLKKAEINKLNYVEMSKSELRTFYYKEGVDVTYILRNKNGDIKSQETIHYKMLYRNSAKAKLGKVMFINEKLYDDAYDWLTMGLGNKMSKDNAKIVEMSAYAPLTTSTIVGKLHIPVEDILILKDQESTFRTSAKVVKSQDYEVTKNGKSEIRKKCIVENEDIDVVNTLWDGMGLIDKSISPDIMNGMLLLRNHFFKMCGFKTDIQLFFQDWCKQTGNDYNTYEVTDMFGKAHKLKDIKVITTDNAIKWKKFKEFMGGDLTSAYEYWCERINQDGSIFGIVKTDHASKLGDVQQMSYQMINTLPCGKEDIENLSQTSVSYVEKLKKNKNAFEKFLRKNATAVNHYEMMADLYAHNHKFANSKWFRTEKRKIINAYVNRLRKGKIFINADNLTVCGNPYGLLLYSVNEDWSKDPTLNYEEGVVQCYTSRFNNGEYLCAIRNPHNSPNNICYLKNVYSDKIERYFHFTPNILAVNCIHTDIQSRANGMDFDSDFMFVTNDCVMVKCAKICYKDYPTIVNALKESGISYQNTMEAYAAMDNKFAGSKMGIGESSNLAQLALTYYWTYKGDEENKKEELKELYDNFVILSVLAQVIIDGCKREYEVDGIEEIKRIKKMSCMKHTQKIEIDGRIRTKPFDYPKFMKYTKEISVTKNGKERNQEDIAFDRFNLDLRINPEFVCPMNWMEECLDDIKSSSVKNTIPTETFFIKMSGKPNQHQMSKIKELVLDYDRYCRTKNLSEENDVMEIIDKFDNLILELKKIKVGNIITINRLIEASLNLNFNTGRPIDKNSSKYTRKMLNCLYHMNKEKFLLNFSQSE